MENIYQSRLYELQSFTGTPGTTQSLQYDIRGLPRGQRVGAFLLAIDFAITSAVNNTTTTAYQLVSQLLAQFDHESAFYKVRATGAGLWTLFHHMNGRTLQSETINLATGTTNYFRAVVVLPVSDFNAHAPTDTAIPTELINGTTLQLVTSPVQLNSLFQVQGGTPNVSGSVAYRLFASLIEGAGPVDPTPSYIDYEDWGGQTVLLKQGTYSHLSVYSDPLGPGYNPAIPTINLDSALTRVTWNIAGTPVLQNVLSWAQVIEFNRASVSGGFVSNYNEQLSTTDGANSSGPMGQNQGVPFLPIYTPPAKYKLTGLPHTAGPDSIIQLNGTQTNFRVLYRRFPEKTESMVRAAGRAFGLDTFERSLKTASKIDVAGGSNAPADIMRRSRISKLIPGRLMGSSIKSR